MVAVMDVLRGLFPERGEGLPAYMSFPVAEAEGAAPYGAPPAMPFDVFAVAGRLLELSGAYHHIVSIGRVGSSARRLDIGPRDLRLVERAAASWRGYDRDLYVGEAGGSDAFRTWSRRPAGRGVADLLRWWAGLVAAGGEPVYVDAEHEAPVPGWWRFALMLFLSADQAAKGVGFNAVLDRGASDDAPPWFEAMAYRISFEQALPALFGGGVPVMPPIITISAADPDVACVLPKARTTAVGCTMRSLSHNLALLPARGVAKGSWMPFVFPTRRSDETHMNILLVPFPFIVDAGSFRPVITEVAAGESSGVFELGQDWLAKVTPAAMVDFIVDLAAAAGRDADRLHAVVFPEMALDLPLYDHLVEALPAKLPGLELLVAGISGDEAGRKGNFVSMTVFQERKGDGGRETGFGLTCRREKHHRWRIDRSQVLAYGLEGVMSASIGWWEDIDLLARRVDFAVVRSGSVVSAMICEDLARVDPCQELIRAMGPSIIFALLMDAPQLKARWPARHATTLAEDPGSAVLTLTSKGLMARQHRLGLHVSSDPSDRVIALWRDDGSQQREIACPDDCQGVLLSLSGTRTVDRTLDGRTDGTAVSWRYARHQALKVTDAMAHAPIVGQ